MSKAILGRKLGMTQIFTEEGTVVPVTVVESGNNVVIMNKTVENDGYNAVQIGFGEVKEKRVTKPLKGHFAKAGVAPVRFIREMRLTDASEYNVGDTIGVDIFAAGDLVDVTGTSKGKGFAGTIKRHNFARGPMGHGSKSHREPGSTGAMISGHGGRVLKGKKLPGSRCSVFPSSVWTRSATSSSSGAQSRARRRVLSWFAPRSSRTSRKRRKNNLEGGLLTYAKSSSL